MMPFKLAVALSTLHLLITFLPVTTAFQQREPPRAQTKKNISPSSNTWLSPLPAIRVQPIETNAPQRRLQSPVNTFPSISDFLNTMDNENNNEAPPDQQQQQPLTVVLFFAEYCKLCHQASIPYKEMAYMNPDVQFTRLETSNMSHQQFRSMGISRVPFVQIYRSGVCVASFSIKWQLESKLKEVLHTCQVRSTGEWHTFLNQFDREIEENKRARENLGLELLLDPSIEEQKTGLKSLASGSQFVDAIRSSNTRHDDRPTVVLFHSNCEPACTRAQYQYRRISEASQYGIDFQWTQIESSVLSKSSLEALGVIKYPHLQVYKDGKCVASFSVPQTYLFSKMVGGSLDQIKARSTEEWKHFFQRFTKELEENCDALETIEKEQLRP